MTRRRTIGAALAAAIILLITSVGPATGVPGPPTGMTALALDGRVELAWQPVSGADSYRVLRGTTPATITQVVSPTGHSATTFTDTGAANGQTFYYAVEAVSGAGASSASTAAGATPQAASCATGNAIVRENCFPGTTAWKSDPGSIPKNDGIAGFATETSIEAGESVGLKVDTGTTGVPYTAEIYRTGHYGGDQGRLIGTLPNLTGIKQPACVKDPANTGLVSCANWSTSATLTTSAAWTTGVYIIKLTRPDNGRSNQILLVVRDDDGPQRLLYSLPDATYQAYNNWDGKSTYPQASTDAITVAGDGRAVKVSFDRPYRQVVTRARDFYTFTDLAAVSWLEQQGYPVAYQSSLDLERRRPDPPGTGLRSIWLGSHHEYWSQAMRDNLTAARDAGVSIASVGGNQIYWKVRYEDDGRTMVVYKSTATGVEDPSGIPTGTWRDPQGANDPENSLLGTMYVGDNDSDFFPLRVPYQQGQHRFWRHTPAAELSPGQTASIGRDILGWEWDTRVPGPNEPEGLESLSLSPVTGQGLLDAGSVYGPYSGNIEATIYEADSGALVFAAGTNHWARGLAPNSRGQEDVRPEIQQATANVLADMRVRPTTPTGITLDPAGDPAVESTSPANGAADVAVTATVRARFDRLMDPATLTGGFTVRRGAGAPIAATVTFDDQNERAVLQPAQRLEAGATYTATLSTSVRDLAGNPLPAPVSWTFTTRPATVSDRSPAPNATGVVPEANVTAVFDAAMDPATLTTGTFTLESPAGSTPAAVTYDAATRTARLDPTGPLALGTTYTARLSTGVRSTAGAPLPAAVSWSFTTRHAFTVTARDPAPLSSGLSPWTPVRATFVRDADPATLTGSTFTLTGPGGPVAATVTYDAAARQATLRPSAPLALLTTYTARLAGEVRAADGQTLGAPLTWTFTTAATLPPAPAATRTAPEAGITDAARDTAASVAFDRALDPFTVTGANVTIRPAAGGSQLAATVGYEAATRTITLTPAAPLAARTAYEVRVTTGVRGADGVPLAGDVAWTFTTLDCPCTLMDGLTPQSTANTTRDNRPAPGPWTYEMGTRIQVDRAVDLTAIRYYRDPLETGSHTGTLWSSTGAVLGQATFTGESSSGWQRAALSPRVRLQPGQTYAVSVGLNSFFVLTQYGLLTPLTHGPLSTVGGASNGVFGAASAVFPTQSWRNSNYFVDAEVSEPPPPAPNPAVVTTSPSADAIGVAPGTRVDATFNKALDAGTVNGSSVTLRTSGGTLVPASVSYDAASRTVRLQPASPLSASETYTARLTTAIESTTDLPMLEDYAWSFTIVGDAPSVTGTSPSGGATGTARATDVRATFSRRLDPDSVTTSTVTVTPAGGNPVAASVSYDDFTRTVRLVPSAALKGGTTYTATVTTGVRAYDGAALAQPVSWTFTTAECPCSLFPSTLTPVLNNITTRDGRPNPGPWTRELGVKVRVTRNAQLTGVRYYRAASETGAHTARIWTASGSLIATVPFAAASDAAGAGWRQQTLAAPIALLPGQTYVVTVGFNTSYSATQFGLQTPIVDGPLQSEAVAANGVYSDAAGTFPTFSYRSSNYFVDAVVE